MINIIKQFSQYLNNTTSTEDMVAIVLAIMTIVAFWIIFHKAGNHGWKAIIPVYNTYTYYKVASGKGWMFLLNLIPSVVGVATIVMMIATYGTAVNNDLNSMSAAMAGISVGLLILFCVCLLIPFILRIWVTSKLANSFNKHGAFKAFMIIFDGIFGLPIFKFIIAISGAKYIGPSR